MSITEGLRRTKDALRYIAVHSRITRRTNLFWSRRGQLDGIFDFVTAFSRFNPLVKCLILPDVHGRRREIENKKQC